MPSVLASDQSNCCYIQSTAARLCTVPWSGRVRVCSSLARSYLTPRKSSPAIILTIPAE